MTIESRAHMPLCMHSITGGMCDCEAFGGTVDLADVRPGDLVKIRLGRLIAEDWLPVDSVGGHLAADGWLLPGMVKVTAHWKVGR